MTILLGVLVVVVGVVLYIVALNLYNQTNEILHHRTMLRMDKEVRRQAMNMPDKITPDPVTGCYPVLGEPGGRRFLDLNRGLSFDFNGLVSAAPEIARPEQFRRMLQAGGWPPGKGANDIPVLLGRSVEWPTDVPLESVVTNPDIKALTLGVTIGEDGQQETVKADMGKLVHIAVGGSSGWGKSVFLRSLGYQLALSGTPVDLAMIDLEGATLAPFARCERLLYPIAETEGDALAVLSALTGELERRKSLYAQIPGVDSLAAYNARADEPLAALVAIIDEATALLGDKSVESALRTLALRARKYGLWLVMAGQDWKASSLDTAIRNQLSSRIQFKAMSKGQSRVLLERSGAESLDVEGRALVILPGKEMFTMQAPFVSAKTILDDCSDGGPRFPMPEGNGYDSKLAERVRALSREGMGLGAISDAVFGYRNAKRTGEIKRILGLE